MTCFATIRSTIISIIMLVLSTLPLPKITQIYQLAFSYLPLLDAHNKTVDVHENIFLKYFKKATFVKEINTLTNIYRTLLCLIVGWGGGG